MNTSPPPFNNSHHSQVSNQEFWPIPKPGELWTVQRKIPDLAPCSSLLSHNLFSTSALQFLKGDGPPRHVMIVGDIHYLSDYSISLGLDSPIVPNVKLNYLAFDIIAQPWVTVMVLGHPHPAINLNITTLDTLYFHQFKPEITSKILTAGDIWLPSHLSGLSHDLVAETWHIVPMLVTQLSHPLGNRLSSVLYHHLMDLGDIAYSSIPQSQSHPHQASQTVEAHLSSHLASPTSSDFTSARPPLEHSPKTSFHQLEQQWSEVLRLPITACHMYLNTLKRTVSIMDKAAWLEQILT